MQPASEFQTGHSSRARLLVSVRDVHEAHVAAAAGVDILDLKEPNRGSLGAVDNVVAKHVSACLIELALVPNRTVVVPRLSLALGELSEWDFRHCRKFPSSVSYCKIGLAGMERHADWELVWNAAMICFPPNVDRVAVAYADQKAALSPSPEEVIAAGHRSGCTVFLLDTFQKNGGTLFELLSVQQVNRLCQLARLAGMQVALAGSLNVQNIGTAIALKPDIIAVRGAICDGGREGVVCAERIAKLQRLISNRENVQTEN